MERVVTTYRIGIHDVDVVETFDDEGTWYHLVADGVARTELLDHPPDAVEAHERILGHRSA